MRYAIFYNWSGDTIGWATLSGGRWRGHLFSTPLDIPDQDDALGRYVADRTRGEGKVAKVSEPVWQFGAVICG